MDNVSVILVNYKTVECAIECIESIKKQDYSNVSVYIVDNASEDNCKTIIESKWSDVKVIENPENVGFSGANNIGIREAIANKAEYLMLLNCDTTIPYNYISTLVKTLKEDSNIGIVSGKILFYYDTDRIWSAGGKINLFKGSSDVFDFQRKNYDSEQDLTECTFISGCCMMIPIDAYNKVGPMSEDYFLYYEDTDYCANFIKAGYKLVTNNRVEMLHKESVSTGKKSELYTYYFTRNRLHFIRKNIVGVNKIIAYVYSYLWIIKKMVIGEFKLKATIWGIKDFMFKVTGKSNRTFQKKS